MTVLEAANLALANCRTTAVDGLSMDEKALLMRCMNAGVQEFFQIAPDSFKRTTATHYLAAPLVLTGLSIACGSTTNTGTPFAANLRGQSILLPGGWNEIVSETELLRANASADTVTTGTVYHDTLVFWGTSVERQAGRVWCIEGSERWPLTRVDAPETTAGFPSPFLSVIGANTGTMIERQIGQRPLYFGTHLIGQSHAGGANDAAFMIRVNPVPDRAFVLEARIDILAPTLNPYSLQDGTTLPVPRERVDSLLLPLIERRLAATRLWAAPAAIPQIMSAWSQARADIQLLPAHVSPPNVKIDRTPGH